MMKTLLTVWLLTLTSFAWAAIELPDDHSRSATTSAVRTTSPPLPVDEPGLVLELKDGSRIVGRFTVKNVPLTITSDAIGAMKIPFEKIQSVQFDKETGRATVTLPNGDTVRGAVTLDALKLTTAFGPITVPVAQLVRINLKGGSRPRQLPDGCVLAYTFDADEGDRVTDHSGQDNHGQVKGAVYVPDGKTGGAMRFGKRGAVVLVGNPKSLQLQNFTFAAWIKRTAKDQLSADNPGMGTFLSYGRGGYIFYIDEEGRIGLSKVGVDIRVSRSGVVDTLYHHIAVTKENEDIYFFIDGERDPRVNYPVRFEFNSEVCVGAVATDLSCSFLGDIDELTVFNRALTSDELKRLYDSQK